ncbi:MAG: PEGA domain-containing protein [Methanoregulaceae archaeon]|nr:PEGA domain-containing protein [Methanoregulaceae archaeon]
MNNHTSSFLCTLILVTCLLGVAAAATTEVKIVKLAADGYTVLNQKNVDYTWMEQHLPVKGDGSTHYYLQGPVFVDKQDDRWNPAEDTNVKEKDMGAVKGTDLADLCSLVGGMAEEDEVTVRASDGFSRTFAYENVYNPPARQGPIIISWYHGTYGYVPAYADGMRLLFLADTSGNPWGVHALGAWDWHESAGEKYWYYYFNGNEQYPTTTGLSVRSVSEILIYSHEEPAGTIRVTSLPEGARIFIDSDEVPDHTPADIPGIPAGTHMVRVELAGYEVPEEISVDVEHQLIADASFDLVEIPVDSIIDTADSSDSGEAETGGESGAAGTALTLSMQGMLQGNVSVTLIQGLNGTMKGGDMQAFKLSVPPPGPDLLQSRIYIFSSNGTDLRSGKGAVPEFELGIAGTTRKPDRIYLDQGGNLTDGTIVTTVFIIPNVTVTGLPGLTLRLKDNPDISCMLEGGAWITVSPRPGSSPVSYWIFEGADMIASPPGTDRPDAETTTEFELPATGPAHTGALLRVVSTGGREDLAGRYQILVNGEAPSGISGRQQGQMLILEVPFHPPSPGSPVGAAIRATINETSGLYGETRLAVFSFIQDADQSPGTGMLTASHTETGEPAGETTSPVTSSSRINTGTPVEPESFPPGDISQTKQQSPFSWLAPVTDRIYSILVLLFGEPADPYTEEDRRDESRLESGPAGVLSTPPALPVSPEVPNQEDLADAPGETNVFGAEPTDQTGAMYGLVGEDPGVASETAGGNRTRHGGVYVMSYPEGVDLRIDNKPIKVHLPIAVYGIKEGTHQVEVRLKSDSDKIISAKTIRVWIHADAITTARFDLIRNDVVQKIRVVSPNGTSDPLTVNGYYPLRRTPTDVEFTGSDSFVTVIRDNSYLTFTLMSVTEPGMLVIPAEMPRLYRIRVESAPPCGDIFVDGMRSGYQTPALIPNLSAGPHRITVSRPGFVPGDTVVLIPVDNDPDVKEPVHFVLETYPCGPLTIESTPKGASISLDGISTGEKTPFTFQHIPLGIHEVTVVRNGESRKSDVVVKPGESRRYILVFEGNGTRPL